MRLSLHFDTVSDQILFSDLREVTFAISELLGSVLTVAVLKIARPRDIRLERFLATGFMTDVTGRVTHSFGSWYRDDPRPRDAVVDMARTICTVGEQNSWVFSWQLKVFCHAFHSLATQTWSAPAARPLLIDTLIRLPPEVNDVAVPLVRSISERVWGLDAGAGRQVKAIEDEKRRRIREALNWGDLEWYDRRGIELGVAEAVMRLDPLFGYAALGDRCGQMCLKLVEAQVGSENERYELG